LLPYLSDQRADKLAYNVKGFSLIDSNIKVLFHILTTKVSFMEYAMPNEKNWPSFALYKVRGQLPICFCPDWILSQSCFCGFVVVDHVDYVSLVACSASNIFTLF
jgi:hypothetical protein